jgi:hypothetical protein
MNQFIIDNCIVSRIRDGYGIRVSSIKMAKKMNPNLEIETLPKITYGNRKIDNLIISNLINGVIKFEELKINN